MFNDEATDLFRDMFLGSSLQTLVLQLGNEFYHPTGVVVADLMLTKNTSLKRLEVPSMIGVSLADFVKITDALMLSSSIESLSVALDDAKCRALMERLPRMKSLKRLELIMYRETADSPLVRHELLQALQRNPSVTKVVVRYYENREEEIADVGFRRQIVSICKRNRHLARFVQRPGAVKIKLWPRIFARALECDTGHDPVFTCLRERLDAVLLLACEEKKKAGAKRSLPPPDGTTEPTGRYKRSKTG
jgi:hypothetical protein